MSKDHQARKRCSWGEGINCWTKRMVVRDAGGWRFEGLLSGSGSGLMTMAERSGRSWLDQEKRPRPGKKPDQTFLLNWGTGQVTTGCRAKLAEAGVCVRRGWLRLRLSVCLSGETGAAALRKHFNQALEKTCGPQLQQNRLNELALRSTMNFFPFCVSVYGPQVKMRQHATYVHIQGRTNPV